MGVGDYPDHSGRGARGHGLAHAPFGVDEDYLDVFQIGLIEGRKFDPMAFPTDTSKAFIINETAVAQLGWDDPLASLLSGLIGG